MRQHMGRQRHKKPQQKATILDLNAAWNRADLDQRRRFIDGIGCQAILDAMPEHQRGAMFALISHENVPAHDLSGSEQPKLTETSDDLSFSQFLRRN